MWSALQCISLLSQPFMNAGATINKHLQYSTTFLANFTESSLLQSTGSLSRLRPSGQKRISIRFTQPIQLAWSIIQADKMIPVRFRVIFILEWLRHFTIWLKGTMEQSDSENHNQSVWDHQDWIEVIHIVSDMNNLQASNNKALGFYITRVNLKRNRELLP